MRRSPAMDIRTISPWTSLTPAETDMLAQDFLESEADSEEHLDAERAAFAMVALAPIDEVWPLVDSITARARTETDLQRIARGVLEPLARRFGPSLLAELHRRAVSDPRLERAMLRMT